jgi:hypothetical protein
VLGLVDIQQAYHGRAERSGRSFCVTEKVLA